MNERHHLVSFSMLLIENPFSACLCNPSDMSFSRYTWVRFFFSPRSLTHSFYMMHFSISIAIDTYIWIAICYCRPFWWTKSNEEVNCKAIKNDTLLFLYTINEGLEILFSLSHLFIYSASVRIFALLFSLPSLSLSFLLFLLLPSYQSFIHHFVTR